MDEILLSLGYNQVIVDNFKREGVTKESVSLLTPEELESLGVLGMGRQALLRGRCRQVNVSHAVNQERTRLFSPYPTGVRSKDKKKKVRTTTIAFVCLYSTETNVTPTSSEMDELVRSGLGIKSLALPCNTNAKELQATLYDEFPKLKEGGGYEYMKATSGKKLVVIPIPSDGYSVRGIRQYNSHGKVFLRPIQKDLDISDVQSHSADDLLQTCNGCGKEFGLTTLREHITTCSGSRHSRPTEESDDDDDLPEVHLLSSTSLSPTSTVVNSTSASKPRSCPNVDRHIDCIQILDDDLPTKPSTSSATVDRHIDCIQILEDELPTKPSTSSAAVDSHVSEYIHLLEEEIDNVSEDEEISQSMEEVNAPSNDNADNAAMQELVKGYQQCKVDGVVEIIIRRRKIWKSTLATIKNQKDFNFLKTPHVHFSGEEAVDLGGPKREFFWLVTKTLQQVGIFEGKPDGLIFTHDLDLLQRDFYRSAGQIVAWSILHGGPGYPYLHPGLLSMMCGATPGRMDLNDIVDEGVTPKLSMIANVQTNADARDVIASVGDWAASNGCNDIYALNENNKGDIVQALIKQHIFYRCKAEIDDFTKGMDDVGGFWHIVKSNQPMHRLLTATSNKLQFAKFKRLFRVNWSEDPILKDLEEETIYCWEHFQRMCSDGECVGNILVDGQLTATTVGLHHILRFVTGADSVPPTGFEKMLDIEFFSQTVGSTNYPTSSTCGLELHLPRGLSDIEPFNALFIEAILCAPGFGKI